jgi:hypothetical protein
MEQALVVAVRQIEPHVLPWFVGRVIVAGGVEGDPGAKRRLHAGRLRSHRKNIPGQALGEVEKQDF